MRFPQTGTFPSGDGATDKKLGNTEAKVPTGCADACARFTAMALGATSGRGASCLLRATGKFAVPISPSQVRPVEVHRLQAGLVSSHFTFRILKDSQSLIGRERE